MQTMIKFAGTAAVVFTLTQALQAAPITGAIGIGGSVTYNTSSAATATQVTSWIAPHVTLDSGSFSVITPGPSAAVTFAPGAWNFNTSSPINNFWAVGGFTFELLSSFVVPNNGTGPNGFVVVDGTGIVSGNGYTPTEMSWTFTSSDPGVGHPLTWTFSASVNSTIHNSVPDGGSAAMLLGLALSSAALLKKKLAA